MLKSITLENYTTYIKKTKVDFGATNYKILEKDNTKNGILKGALFVGENASGKTNILKAIRLLVAMLCGGESHNFSRYVSFYSGKDKFTIDYEFEIQSSIIIYSLVLSRKQEIIREKLIKDDKVILERHNNKIISLQNNVDFQSIKVPDTLLFARKYYFDTHFSNDKILNKWFDFISNSIYIDCTNRKVTSDDTNFDEVYYHKYLDRSGVEEINNILSDINYQQSIIYANTTPETSHGTVFQDDKKFVAFCKAGTDVYVPEYLESTGNKTLIGILPAIIYATKHDCMLIVNEFSSGLYNDLEKSLIRYFFTHSKKSQLFFTTHSTNILSNTILRPDQEYSVRFDYKSGGSQISRFSDQSPREAQNIEKMYLNGVFDDVPDYNKNFSA